MDIVLAVPHVMNPLEDDSQLDLTEKIKDQGDDGEIKDQSSYLSCHPVLSLFVLII